MRVKFWGTRGSVPVPGKNTIRYGGNTSCVEVQSESGTHIVIDAGTGLRVLGYNIIQQYPKGVKGHVLIGHTHWDHIQGIPFFLPFFLKGYSWDVYGPKGLSQSIRDTLAGQMQYSYFPVDLEHFGASINYHDLVEGTFTIDDVTISTRYLNHTVLTCGFRVEVDGMVVVYLCDHEPYSSALASGDHPIVGQDEKHARFAKDADLLIHDSQYMAKDFESKIGWGHSTMEYAVRIAEKAGVKRLALTHHEPLCTDDIIDKNFLYLKEKFPQAFKDMEIFIASEGMDLDLGCVDKKSVSSPDTVSSATDISKISATQEQLLLYRISDKKIRDFLLEAAASHNIISREVQTPEDIKQQSQLNKIALVVIDNPKGKKDAVSFVEALKKEMGTCMEGIPVVLLCADESLVPPSNPHISETLVMPLTQAYLQTKLLAWFLRVACHWSLPPIPVDELKRLAALHELNILDTKGEDRFDRITRIASSLFNVPMSMISFIDADRQWFKSSQGVDIKESARDISFCAHAVAAKKTLVVTDTALDNRFADNPLVTQSPRLRFYAGSPLILKNGACIGTLCLADTRPRALQEHEVKMLNDLRDMVLDELYLMQPQKKK